MLFNSLAFAVFLPAMLTVYWSLRGPSRHRALLLGSYVFYAWCDWRLLSLLLLVTATAFLTGLGLARYKASGARRVALGSCVCVCLGTLGWFKYFGFFRSSLVNAAATVGWNLDLPVVAVILPIGISFYTFQAISYAIDVFRGAPAERCPWRFSLYIACFPQLVAGPIMRASRFLPQLVGEPRVDRSDVSHGVYRIFCGLFKKMVVADSLAVYVDLVFGAPGEFAGVSAWIALYAYAFQIYLDFSGYCDVAVGVGRLLGLRFDENFNYPYLACSPSEFWKRWHITLSTWLRDYLYLPLGGSHSGMGRTVRNLVITMALGGLWHGAAWTFVAWGLYHGLLLAGARLLRWNDTVSAGHAMTTPERIVKTVIMFHLTCVGWLFFRAADWNTVVVLGGNLLDFSGETVHGRRIAVIVALCMAFHVLPALRALGDRFARIPAFGQGALAGAFMWALLLCGLRAQAFIYFQF